MTMTVPPSNFSYLEEYLGFRPSSNPDDFDLCLEVMKKYSSKGDTWWYDLRGDSARLAARQIDEPVLLIRYETFVQGVALVMGQVPEQKELSCRNKAFIAKFKEKFEEYIKTH